jgi:hypothetical protein
VTRPFIFTVCDQLYRKRYADGFIKSARANGHEVEVFCDGGLPLMPRDAIRYTTMRFRMLPELLRKYESVLIIDIDSLIMKPIEIAPEYDLGLCFRDWKTKDNLRILAAMSYFTQRSMEFAEMLAEKMDVPGLKWTGDQLMLWQTYKAIGHKFNIFAIDRDILDWEDMDRACVFTAKGPRKRDPEFVAAMEARV